MKDVYRFFLIRTISKATSSKFKINARTEITIDTEYENKQTECMELYNSCKDQFNLKSKKKFDETFSVPNVTKALTKLGIKGLSGLRLERPDKFIQFNLITITNHSLYLVGRYNKYSRELSQTPWLIDDKIRMDSVEEVITRQLKKHIICESMFLIN